MRSAALPRAFAGRANLRPRKLIPYLTWRNCDKALTNIGWEWKTPLVSGVARLARHVETWMNLLVAFGAQNILGSPYLAELPVNSDELPAGCENPFAMQLECASSLVALLGCDTITEEGNALSFACENARLDLVPGGPYGRIGRFS